MTKCYHFTGITPGGLYQYSMRNLSLYQKDKDKKVQALMFCSHQAVFQFLLCGYRLGTSKNKEPPITLSTTCMTLLQPFQTTAVAL